MAFSIRLTEQEKKIADSYARLHSISLGEAFKQALFEKIEEEYDLAVFDDADVLPDHRGDRCGPDGDLRHYRDDGRQLPDGFKLAELPFGGGRGSGGQRLRRGHDV